ncbi:hypothetical protein CPC08DRAFT_516494 [Agrocybe pediades]|nr:hypothetical protein CPC08DRAFT_516494 [Agrocybe pediades]
MSGRSRNDFTESDDDHLIEYIATHNPDPSGRLGNKLYVKLTENGRNGLGRRIIHGSHGANGTKRTRITLIIRFGNLNGKLDRRLKLQKMRNNLGRRRILQLSNLRMLLGHPKPPPP